MGLGQKKHAAVAITQGQLVRGKFKFDNSREGFTMMLERIRTEMTKAECRRMRLGAPDESGRRRPEPITGSEFTLAVDIVVLAIGYEPDDLLEKTTPGLRTTNWKTVRVDEDYQTTRAGVFAGGDNVNGADLVVTAMADGRRAAVAIDNYLQALG